MMLMCTIITIIIIIIIINKKISVRFSPKTARTHNTQKKTTCSVDKKRNKRVSSAISVRSLCRQIFTVVL